MARPSRATAAALRALAGDYDRRVRAACADAMPAVAERPSAAAA
jgi:hypothetical protein